MGKRGRNDIGAKNAMTDASWTFRTNCSAYLLCLTIPDGNTIFNRKIGDLKTLPLSTVGILNGLKEYTSSCGFQLTETKTCDARVVWKDYHSLRFILITNDDGNFLYGNYAHNILDHIFNTLVMFLGLDQIKSMKNIEKFKTDLEVCYSVIDLILEQLNQDSGLLGDLIGCTDCILSHKNATLKAHLDTFAQSVNSQYACILVRGKTAVATQSWWMNLHHKEKMLISLVVTSAIKCGANEQIIFLPYTSPLIPHRLISFQLINGMHLCLLVGHSPSLNALHQEVPNYWQDFYADLKSLSNLQPRNFPENWVLDHNIIAFMLVDMSKMKCLVSYQPATSYSFNDGTKKDISGKPVITSIRRRQEILRSFYKHVTETFWNPVSKQATSSGNNLLHDCPEVYFCLDHHKCFALQAKEKRLFIVTSSVIPNYALRSVTHKTLKILTGDKSLYL